jgi:soluble lytic murein transglycosylase-like protein
MKILFMVLLTISSAHGGGLEEYISKKNPNLSQNTVREISSELKKYPKIITRIAERESTFNPKAKNKGSVGLMGVNTKVWFSSNPNYNLIKLGIIKSKKELFSIRGNLKAGSYILKKCNRNYRRYRGLCT